MEPLTNEEKELIDNYRKALHFQQRAIREGAAALSRVAQTIKSDQCMQ